MASKTYRYLIYSSAGTYLGQWPDAPRPAFGLRSDGYDSITVRLPRSYGALDVPGDATEGPGTLTPGNRLDIYVADADTIDAPNTSAVYGTAVYGSSTYGMATAAGRLVWRGTIRQLTPDLDRAAVDLLISPLATRLGENFIETALTITADVAIIAKRIVDDWGHGLTWDARNPVLAGVEASVSYVNQAIGDALSSLRDLAGANWLCFVTITGTVRFFAAAVDGTPDHRLVSGRHAQGAKLELSELNRRKRVIVAYATGTVTAQAADYTAADPRAMFQDAGHITDEPTAQTLADNLLAERDRVVWRGQATVIEGQYDIESIQIGDTVRLYAPQPIRESAVSVYGKATYGSSIYGGGAGYGDYAGRALAVTGLNYAFTSVALELSQNQPRQRDEIAKLLRRLPQTAANRLT